MLRNNKFRFFFLIIPIFLFSCAPESYRLAEKMMEEGRYDDAITYYQKALNKSPKDFEYRMKLLRAKEAAAKEHFKKGVKLMNDGSFAEAEKEFNLTLVLDPNYKNALNYLQDLRRRREAEETLLKAKEFFASNRLKEAYEAAQKAYSLNPTLIEAKELSEKFLETSVKSKLEYELSFDSSKPVTLKFKDANIKDVFEVLSKLSGINFVFDDAIRDKKVTIFIEDATFVQALELLLYSNKLAVKIVNPKNIIIFPDTKQKRNEYDEYYIKTFFLKHADAKKLVNIIRSLIQARQIFVNEEQNAIVIRADEDSLEIAEKVIEANDLPKPEVVLNLEFLEVSRNDIENLGIDFSPLNIQAGFAKGNPPGDVTSSTELKGTLVNIKDLESSMFERNVLFTLPTVTLNFLKQIGVTKTLANPQLRALDGSKSQVHVGDRVPVITVTVSGVDNRSENVQYVDVGVKFNAEPKILSNDEVEIKIEAEVSNIVSENKTPNGTTVYRIGTRNAKTVLRLKDGETSVLGGLIQSRTSKNKSGIIFLSDIPLIGRLFSNYKEQVDQSDIFISITPQITKGVIQPPLSVTKIWSGTEEKISARPVLKSVKEPTDSKETPPAIRQAPTIAPSAPKIEQQSVQPSVEKEPSSEQPKAPSQPEVLLGVKPEDAFKDEMVFVAPVVPESISVGESVDVEIAFSEIPPVVEFEITGQVNPLFLEPIQFKENRPPMKEDDLYQWKFDDKSGNFTIFAKVADGIAGSFTVGTLEVKGKRKVQPMEMITIRNCIVKTKDGKQYNIRTVNGYMEVQ